MSGRNTEAAGICETCRAAAAQQRSTRSGRTRDVMPSCEESSVFDPQAQGDVISRCYAQVGTGTGTGYSTGTCTSVPVPVPGTIRHTVGQGARQHQGGHLIEACRARQARLWTSADKRPAAGQNT